MEARKVYQLAIVFIILLSLGCGKNSTSQKIDPPPAPFVTRTSPQNLLMNLKEIYNTKTFDQFTDLFDDQFEFHFSDADVASGEVPETLSKVAEVSIHEVMVGGDWIDSLELEYSIGPMTLDETMTTVAGDSVWTITITSITLELKGRLPGWPEMTPMTWRMDNGECRFWFQKHGPGGEQEIDPYSGEHIWTIYRWQEMGHKARHSSVDTQSWGGIKAMFN